MSASALHILLVDDDADIRFVLQDVLEHEGYTVSSAENGEQALAFLGAQSAPNLILLDLMMPVMNGFEFRDRQMAHPEWAKIPVVVMSADVLAQQRLDRLQGATFLRKPPELQDFLRIVKENSSQIN